MMFSGYEILLWLLISVFGIGLWEFYRMLDQPIDPATGTALGIDTDGNLGTFLSSEQYKKDIKPMGRDQ